MSWGNNIDNYSGGYCQHVYHANNHFQNVWAGDREVMTFDPVLGDYFGGVTCTGTKCTLSTSGTGSANAGSMGGMVSILAGTGAGQYRRLIGIDSTKAVITIDEPFTTALDTTSMMQLGPFKGRFIFDQNRYEDCGAFQLVSLMCTTPHCRSVAINVTTNGDCRSDSTQTPRTSSYRGTSLLARKAC
jgi:hypothetical protein